MKRRRNAALALTAASLPIFRVCAGAGWASALLGGLLAATVLTGLNRLLRGRSLSDAADCGAAGKAAAGLLAAALAGLAVWAARTACLSFRETAGNPLAIWLLLVLAWTGAGGGETAPARCAAVLLPMLGVLYGAVLVFSLPQLRLAWLRPEIRLRDVLRCFGCLLLPGAALCCLRSREGALPAAAWISALLAGAAAAVTGGLLSPALAPEANAFLTASRSVSLLGVVQRFEALISAAEVLSGFCLCAELLAACKALIGRAAGSRRAKNLYRAIPFFLLPLCTLNGPEPAIWCSGIAIYGGLLLIFLPSVDQKKKFQKKQKNA